MRFSGEWLRPASIGAITERHDGFVYNFVLDRCHSLLVGGVECVTWGHGFDGPIVEHPYFGTERVVTDLQTSSGWSRGLVHIQGFVRDSSGDVVGLVPSLDDSVASNAVCRYTYRGHAAEMHVAQEFSAVLAC